MINNLDEFFGKIENPLENQNNIRRFVNAYATRGGSLSSFIEALNQQYSRRGNVISTEDYNWSNKSGGEENEVDDIRWISVDNLDSFDFAFDHREMIEKAYNEYILNG